MKKQEKPFCAAPFTGLNIRNNGTIRTCCSSTGQFNGIVNDAGDPINLNNDDILEAWNSSEIKQLRLDMLSENYQGYAKHCAHCIKQESIGLNSMRTRHNMTNSNLAEVSNDGSMNIQDLKALDLRFNTKCDQACIMCGPLNSSMWQKEMSTNLKDWNKTSVMAEYKKVKSMAFKEIDPELSSLNRVIENLTYLELRGGEPLVDKKALKFLKHLVDTGRSKKIYLSIVTNVQNVTSEIIKLFRSFKGGMIRCSIDAIDKKNRYHRHRSDWNRITTGLKNLSQLASWNWQDDIVFDEWRIYVLPTLTIYNCFQWKEYFEWFDTFAKENNFPFLIMINTVKGRPELYHTILPKKERVKTAQELERLKGVLWLHNQPNNLGDKNLLWFEKLIFTLKYNQDDDAHKLIQEFWKWTAIIEKSRGQKLFEYFPELEDKIYVGKSQ